MDPARDARLVRWRAEDLYVRYCVAVDQGDLEDLAAMVLPDVKLTRVDGTRVGVDAFLDLYRGFNADLEAHEGALSQHVTHNVRAWVEDDGRIQTRAYFQASLVRGESAQLVLGNYADVHVEQAGEHLLAHKVIDVQRVVALPAPLGH